MAYFTSGSVAIDGASFWMWVQQARQDWDTCYKPTVDFEHGLLVLTTEGGRQIEIDGVEFWQFVLQHCPFTHDALYKFGKPIYFSHEVTVAFVAATSDPEDHPSLVAACKAIESSWKSNRSALE